MTEPTFPTSRAILLARAIERLSCRDMERLTKFLYRNNTMPNRAEMQTRLLDFAETYNERVDKA